MHAHDAASASFLAHWKGPTPSGSAIDELGRALRLATERARAAWPGVPLEDGPFAAWLGERAPRDAPPAEALGKLRADALYLACACARRVPQALAAFEQAYFARVPQWLSRLRADASALEDAQQLLREKLFVGSGGAAPRIAQYGGQGSLESWLRVAAVRTALTLLEARGARPDDGACEVAEGVAVSEPELDYIKDRYRGAFSAAFREALEALPRHERALLRFHYVERLTPARIGAIYRVHRTTAARQIAQAQKLVLEGTRARLIERLGVSADECDSLVELLKSRLHVTLDSALRSTAG